MAGEAQFTGREILRVLNRHVDGCGEPPLIVEADHYYVSYFRDGSGDQFVFVADVDAEGRFSCTLYCGDAGWDHAYTLTAALGFGRAFVAGGGNLVMSAEVKLWLAGCWEATKFHHKNGDGLSMLTSLIG